MKVISPKIHGMIDYLVVAFLLISPTLFHLPHITSVFTYILAIVHLCLTVSTKFPAGIFKIIPLPIHGWIELIVSIALVGVAFYLGSYEGMLAQYFYFGFAAAVFVTWILSDYSAERVVNKKV